MYFLALDNAAFFAVNSLVEDVFVLTTSFTTYLSRPVSEGVIKAYGKVVNISGSQFMAESVLYDSEGKEIGRGNGIFVRSRIPLNEDTLPSFHSEYEMSSMFVESSHYHPGRSLMEHHIE